MSGIVCIVCPFAGDEKAENNHVDLARLVWGPAEEGRTSLLLGGQQSGQVCVTVNMSINLTVWFSPWHAHLQGYHKYWHPEWPQQRVSHLVLSCMRVQECAYKCKDCWEVGQVCTVISTCVTWHRIARGRDVGVRSKIPSRNQVACLPVVAYCNIYVQFGWYVIRVIDVVYVFCMYVHI